MIISLNKSGKLNSVNHLWTQAIDHSVYIRNRSPTQALKGITPYEAWTGKKPRVAHFQEFGTDVWILDEDKSKSKFDPRTNKHIFVGFNDSVRSVKYYKIRTCNILESRNAKFNTDDDQIEVPLKEAKESPEWHEWEKAIQSELNMLHEKGTWKMAELPEGRKAIGNRWVFTKKFDNQGKLSRYKARLVDKDFHKFQAKISKQHFH